MPCSKLSTCEKIKVILDKNLPLSATAQEVGEACMNCKEKVSDGK
jgi:hypothetical protein